MNNLYNHINNIENDEFADFLNLSARLGMDPLLVQGAGGNTSIKLDDVLWVKASGFWLKNAQTQDMFVPLKLAEIRNKLRHGETALTEQEILSEQNPHHLRPSIETTLHALMDHKVVVHLHSINALTYAVRKNGRHDLEQLLADTNWSWVPYAKPGLSLTKAVQAVISEDHPDVILLSNHGILLGANSVEELEQLLDRIESRLFVAPRTIANADMNALQVLADNSHYRLPDNNEVHALALDKVAMAIAESHALYPDHVVFLGAGPMASFHRDNFPSWCQSVEGQSLDVLPKIVLIENHGVLVRKDLSLGAHEMAQCLAALAIRLSDVEHLAFLEPAQEQELLEWEAEKYRQSLHKTSAV